MADGRGSGRLPAPVCKALDFAHAEGVYHRDLKPQNVMLTAAGEARLMDFGIARVLDDRRDSLSRTGNASGTPIYMAPEMWENGAIDARTDVYLAGLLFAELLTFKPTGDPAEAPRPSESSVPAAWLDLFSRATSRSKRDRPQTIRAFLDRLLEGIDERPRPGPHRQPRRSPTSWPNCSPTSPASTKRPANLQRSSRTMPKPPA